MENPSHRLAPGIVRLDGADTDLMQRAGHGYPGKPDFGMKVKTLFSEERRGGIYDIKYFARI
jgi:uncharacterized OB-fold protein